MEWTRLLSTKRQRQNRYKSQKYGDADLRSEFEKIITESSAVRHLGDFRIRHRYFHWIKVILSVRD